MDDSVEPSTSVRRSLRIRRVSDVSTQADHDGLYYLQDDVLSQIDEPSKRRTKLNSGEPRKIKREQPKSPETLSPVSGVYYHPSKDEWRAVIGRGLRRQQKTFSCRRHGFHKAKELALERRLAYEKEIQVSEEPLYEVERLLADSREPSLESMTAAIESLIEATWKALRKRPPKTRNILENDKVLSPSDFMTTLSLITL